MTMVIERMAQALNRHDLKAFLGCFDPNYRSEQPAHPNPGFGSKEQVSKNWSGMFESFPDFEAQLLRYTAADGVEWGGVALDGHGAAYGRGNHHGGGRGPHRLGALVYGTGRRGWPGH